MNRHSVVVALIISMSLVLIVGILHPVFAQDFGTSKSSYSAGGTSNKGATGAGTKSSDATEPDLVLSPTSGPPGGTFGVHATQLSHNSQVMIDNPFSGVSHGNADQYGNFVTTITVPKGTPPGTYHVKLEGITGSKTYAFADVNLDEIFTVTGQDSKTTNANVGHPNPSPPPPPPPKPPQSPTTNSANGGGSSIPSITLNPTSGYAGTEVKITGINFEGTATLSAGGKEIAKSSNVAGFGNFISVGSDGSLTGLVTIPSDAQPGPYPIQIDSDGPTAKAMFTVLKEPTFADIKTIPGVKGPSTPQEQPGIKSSVTSGKLTPSITLPKTTVKTTLPTTSSKSTSLITPSKSTGTISPKIPSVKSCPTGSVAASGKCISKGAVVAILQ